MDLILYFLSCTVGTWDLWFISTKHLYLENLSYIKKQEEQAKAETKQYHQSNQQWKPVLSFFGSLGDSHSSLQQDRVRQIKTESQSKTQS